MMAFLAGDIPGIFGIDYGHYGLCTFAIYVAQLKNH